MKNRLTPRRKGAKKRREGLNLFQRVFRPKKIERVVVRGANWVGDGVMSVPALREIRRLFPSAHITLATRAWASDIFADADFIDEILVSDRQDGSARALVRQVREWRERRFDCALLFPNSFEAALTAFLSRVPLRTGYASDARRALLTHPLPVPGWRGKRHEAFYYLNIVSELERSLYGSSEIMEREPVLHLEVSEKRRAAAAELLRSHGVFGGRPVVALCPGSTNSRAKRWPVAAFAALADKLVEEAGAAIVLVGSAEEAEVSNEVAGLMNNRAHILTGRTKLAEAVAVLSVTDLLVTNDTGPAHIAAALERPTLVIFGPTNPVTTRPLSNSAEIIRRPPECAPCMLRDCPIDHRCMTAITPEEVKARAIALMREARAEARA